MRPSDRDSDELSLSYTVHCSTLAIEKKRVVYRRSELIEVGEGYLEAKKEGVDSLRKFISEREEYTDRVNGVSLIEATSRYIRYSHTLAYGPLARMEEAV